MKKQYVFLIIFTITIVGIFLLMTLNKNNTQNNILIENSYITIPNNSSYSFKALCSKKDCTLNYKSSDENIFTVNQEGDILSFDTGVAVLFVESEEMKKEVTIHVSDNEPMITGINIKEDSLELNKGEKYLLEVQIFPNKAIYENLEWTSSDPDVLTVNNGYIEAKNDGVAKISVQVDNTNVTDEISVKVGKGATKKIETITFEQEVVTMGLNENYQLTPIIRPIDALNKSLTYIVGNQEIIEVSETGLIKSKGKGETTITVLATNGVSSTLDVKVETTDEDLAINTEEITISKGETYQLKSNYVTGIEWYSNNNKVATVNSSGLIKGVSNGEAIITVVNKYGRINTTKVVVKGSGIPVSSIVLDKKEISLKPGSSYKMSYSVIPTNATNKELSWETSDSRIATVKEDGTIMALRTGEAIVTAYSNSLAQSSLKVVVSPTAVNIDILEINPASITLLKGDTFTLKANIIPSNATNKDVIWETSDSKIVSIDSNGKISANKTGNAVITATSNGLVSKANVEVKASIVEITSLNINENDLSLNVGETITLSTTFLPTNASNKNFIWESSSNAVSVSNTGQITAMNSGTATITVKSTNGKKDTIKVIVSNQSSNPNVGDNPSENKMSVSEVLLNLQNINLHIGQTKQLKATVLPLNAINNSLTWISSNESVVTVSSSGLLTGIKPGTAQVSVITANGKVAKTTVTVTYPPIYDSGSKLLEMYSDKLIVTMTQDSQSKIKIIRVWVADPYKQFHKSDSQNAAGSTVSSIINGAISERNLINSILIGGNAMFTNGGRRIGNISITEGNTWHYAPGGANGYDEAGNTLFYSGITIDGKLKVYESKRVNQAKEKELFEEIIDDGVKNTIVLPQECLFIRNGQKVNVSWDDRSAIRHTLCQVNTNNFIITISSNGDLKSEHQAIQLNAGCITGINLDGGGSANVFYKNRGSSYVSAIRETNRNRPDAIYFSEY